MSQISFCAWGSLKWRRDARSVEWAMFLFFWLIWYTTDEDKNMKNLSGTLYKIPIKEFCQQGKYDQFNKIIVENMYKHYFLKLRF